MSCSVSILSSSGLLSKITYSRIQPPESSDSGCQREALPKFVTSGDLKRVFHSCNQEEKRIFSTMLLTGMRKGEMENLTWKDVQFELSIIFIQAKEGWNPKSDERIIPISPVLYQILQEQYRNRRTEHWVFSSKEGNRLSHPLDRLKRICVKAGMKQATFTV